MQARADRLVRDAITALREVGRPVTVGAIVAAIAADVPGEASTLGATLWSRARVWCLFNAE